MGAFYQGLLIVLLVVVIQCEEHLYAHGPFGKAHLTIDIPSPYNCNRTIDLFSRSIWIKSVGITDLKVSTTNYTNNEAIVVSWTPTSTPCKDDFIGVYFVETPVDTGMQ